RDKCLKDFQSNMVTLEPTTGEISSGVLRVENTGLEFVYRDGEKRDKTCQVSFILYKCEYGNIQALVRYHDELTEENKKQRQKQLKKTYHPNFFRKLKRKTLNVFKTIRDSVVEVANMMISHVKKTSTSTVLTSQGKYVDRMKNDFVGSVGTSYEPLLERYIGHKILLELIKGQEVVKYCGILKEYTADFIELMDVDYLSNEKVAIADIIVGRKYGIVRGLGE
ncbi:MAG: hypothetical protein KAS96_06370, partial [Planctomycetes bacterium]|nr:hypothetical protein [Planctomycetota bacterium]